MLRPVSFPSSRWFAAGALGLLAVAGACSSKTETTPENSYTPALPPAPGPMQAGDGNGVVFAVQKLYLGETNRDGSPNTTNGWRQYGFDLDGKNTTPESTDVCQVVSGGSKELVYNDGDNGIDNAFGEIILPIILSFAPTPSMSINDAINTGSFTILFQIQKLGSGDAYNPLMTQLYGGKGLMSPKWDGTDQWPIVPELLANPTDPTVSKIKFPGSYVVSNTWVSGDPNAGTTIQLQIGIAGYNLTLEINHALIDMTMSADHKKATNGTIAGIINTSQLIDQLGAVAGAAAGICPGDPTFDTIANKVRQASDILSDGSQDPSKTCDGISIGIGFDAAAANLGPIAPPAMPGTNPCSGTGGSGTGGSGTGGTGGAP